MNINSGHLAIVLFIGLIVGLALNPYVETPLNPTKEVTTTSTTTLPQITSTSSTTLTETSTSTTTISTTLTTTSRTTLTITQTATTTVTTISLTTTTVTNTTTITSLGGFTLDGDWECVEDEISITCEGIIFNYGDNPITDVFVTIELQDIDGVFLVAKIVETTPHDIEPHTFAIFQIIFTADDVDLTQYYWSLLSYQGFYTP